jgi:tetratricopeptide (TPR) repeat protein
MSHSKCVLSLASLIVFATLLISGCANVEETKGTSAANNPNGTSGKIPITTSSEEARKEFLTGRDFTDRLLIQDSVAHYDKAIALDPNFALAELARANNSPSAKEFFDHLKKSVSLADKASNGEKLLILGTEAGANGNPTKQKEYLEQLVAAYPNDERGHFALGGYYFGQQDFPKAIEHYKKATELEPKYSGAFNILGYAYRQAGDYASAEQAFKKYTELIPNDPNPYDSYAELLLKMGRFDESIAQYRKALSIDQKFMASHLGISADLLYQGKAEEAAAELQKINEKARNDADRRLALFGLTVVDVDSGKMDKALQDVDQQYALAEKINDSAQMAGDLQTKGTILLEMGKYDEAKAAFEKSVKLNDDSNLSSEIKDNAKLFHHYNLAKIALGKKDLATAKTEAEQFRTGSEAKKNSFQIKQAHELMGMIAFNEKDYDKSIAELLQANQQNPYDLYRLCQAYEAKGDATKSKETCTKAATFNPLPQLNFAFIRAKAQKTGALSKA